MLDNISLTITYTTPAVPVEAAGSLVVTPQAGSYVNSPFNITEDFTSTQAVNTCQYTLNGGTTWTNGAVSGTGPYTCTASNVSATNGTALAIQMRASNTSGASWSTVAASLNRTVDTVAPTDGTLTATAASSSQINLNWTAANDSGSGLNATSAYKVVRADATTTPPADCSGTAIYQGTLNSYNDTTGLVANTAYAYRVCAYDALNNFSGGTTATATTQAGASCTANTPTLAVSPSSSLVAAGANMLYTVTVTNNDSGAGCGNVTYNLVLGNSNTTDFTITAISPASLSIAPAGQGSATFTVTAKAAAADGAINTSTVSVTASGHNPPPGATAQTTVNSGGSPLLHNSANLDPQNLKGYGTWGTSYDCSTCHIKNSTNVKRLQDNIVTPKGSRPVVFYRMTASAANAQGTFGDDLRTTYANASRNVCEVCHHQTLYHQYSSTKIADRSTNPHYNRKDCMSCHPHSAGFKGAGCDGCHGNPPTSTATLVTSPEATLALGNPPTKAGVHATHVTSEGMKCVTCHSGNTMPTVSKTIQMGFDINNTNWPGFAGTAAFGSFSGHSPLGGSPAYSFVSSKSGTVVNTSASYRTSCNVYCHGQWTGANGSINPSWIIDDGTQSACGTCHAATAANPPATGKHATHAGSSAGNYGFSCTKCHPNANGGFSHVNGSVQWRLSSSTNGLIGSTATYTPGSGTAGISGQTNAIAPSATYGTCTNIYCHSTAQGSTGTSTGIAYTSPKWSDAALGCNGCHADMSGASGTGDHAKHANTYGFTCLNCHGSGYTSSSITTATHVNRNVDLKFSNGTIAPLTTYQKGTSFPAGSAAYSYCSNSYCHSNGQSDNAKAAIYRQPVWGTTVTNCGSCHNNMATFANATSGSHFKHANTTSGYAMACTICHGASYTSTSVPTGSGSSHVNKQINLAFTGTAAGTNYSKTTAFAPASGAYGTCTTNYCHSNGQSDNAKARITRTVTWGATVNCGSCHNDMKAFANASSGSHKMHAQGNPNYDCAMCHSGYTATTVTTSTHADSKINLGFTSTALNTVYSKYSAAGFATAKGQYGTCSKSSCHGGGKPLWGSDTTRPECFKCHGSQLTTGFTNVSAASVAPGYNTTDGRDTAGNTAASSARVGAHQGHLVGSDNISDKVHCGECHTTHTTVTDATHLNYTTATMTFGLLAKSNTAAPSVSRASGVMTCSNTYCHGAKMPGGDTTGANKAPAWNATGYLPSTLTAPGSCNTCHGFPPSTASGHPTATAPPSFPTGNCNCHANISTTGSTYATIFVDKTKHINGIYEPAASGCKGCHGTGSVKDMQTEFARNSHHINKAWADITDADCVVCHAEGTISGGSVSVVSNRHGNDTGTKGVVDLYNADTRTTIYSITLTDLTAKTAAGNTANATLDTFCFSCHDSNGAAAVTTANGFSGTAINTATNPFSEVVGTYDLRNSYDQVKKSFGAAPASLNVYDAFATTNNSNHAVRAARYTTATLSAPYQSLKQAGLLSTTVQVFSGQGTAGVADNSQLHCNDCHSTAYSAHGSANEYLLQTATEENPTVEHLALTSYVCQKCHSSTVYTTTGTHVGNSSDYQPQSNTTAVGSARLSNTSKGKGHITGIACLNCHDGDVGFGGIHGFPNATYVDGAGLTQNKRRFMPGAGLYKYVPSATISGDGAWDMATPDNKCYTLGTATSMSACTQHSGGTSDGARNVRRPVTY
ncbi:CxxxxCH/CxxCH domain-containing protein [Geotalea sp. SG265]|uniref:CxxxxCH/CxxCH domain c-type cytochrome n=1 Tax=Geotalea sp. SG265 TaxID=2922867 RepID=UPI001FB00C90|nr:CxxxxCH/CxxCH domain-containing protein [Geotalea sp. SG265]